MRSSVAREYALYRVTLDDEMMFIFAERRLACQSGSHPSPDVDA